MYSYNKLSWQQSKLFNLLKKLGESITPCRSRNISPLLCSWAGCGATWVSAPRLWYNHAHCTENPLCISAGWILVCNFEEQTFWKDSGGHSRWEEMYVLLLGSLWDVARTPNHCHFKIYRRVWVAKWCLTLCDPVDCSPISPWSFPGKNTRVGCYSLLQGIFLSQGLNTHLLNWQADSLSLSTREAKFIGTTI